MKKLLQAPHLALATLWADQLAAAGVGASVQRAHACAIVGQIPPDQALPEVWVDDESDHARAEALLAEWSRLPERRWACPSCTEIVEGPFEQCWNCGAPRPADP
ncbi:MAG: putative signal transducing protein [Pseudomonadota bacterium]